MTGCREYVWPTQLDDLRKALHSALHARPVSNRTALVCRTEQCALAAELVDNTEAVDTSVACSSLSRAVTAIVDIRQDRWSAQLVQLPQALDLVPSTRGVGSRRMSAGCPPQRALPAQLVDDAEARDASTLSCLPRCVGSRAVKLRQDSHPVLPAQLPQGSLVPLTVASMHSASAALLSSQTFPPSPDSAAASGAGGPAAPSLGPTGVVVVILAYALIAFSFAGLQA
eukprot:CAMPEP_0206222258 /NCGR_PEP_ID=MMETSP0047_2-20121206/5863_1 /ASSEMBLY_ACC=CAM_ASM_000192 /TAXON_ID=195065 /ORGANISM="Chroomonas mesostigmatica_cf, Strain CCMP1168" /LENGTH=226 /DNA_ID=CAMNT_0053645069 /DNA_START=262 /DNA_END=940 /DNA_ORIENTATION=-